MEMSRRVALGLGEGPLVWLRDGRHTSPKTNAELAHTALSPNHTLRSAIEARALMSPALHAALAALMRMMPPSMGSPV